MLRSNIFYTRPWTRRQGNTEAPQKNCFAGMRGCFKSIPILNVDCPKTRNEFIIRNQCTRSRTKFPKLTSRSLKKLWSSGFD